MTLELKILPSGSLSLLSADEAIPLSPSLSELRDALSREIEEGLFLLVALKNETALTPSLLFWKDFTSLYLTKRCHHPEDENGVLPPLPFFQGGASTLILGAPPMQGGEYLSLSLLEDLWNTLDQWLLASLQKKQLSFAHFLEQSAPQWHSVGRVCFHLAESKKTPETPFAFLATYSSQISKGKIYHHTLGKALQEYAGSQNKKALIHLLSPVYRASESSPFIQKRVESGAIYEPQLWSPQEAYTFLREVPLYEEAGIVVRVPDWWQARSPRRPNVQITIDQKKQNTLNSESLLDFQIQLALGEETLSLSEWQELLNSPEDGLVFLKGQWIELDKEKLSQTLEHWKRVEKHYRSEGISFIEGMRLLAGAPPDLTSEPLETLPQWSRVQAGKNLEKILNDLRHPQNLESREIGSDLKTSLRPYQQQGVHWLFYLKQLGLGACLADDMGLGKTLQVLALLLLLKKNPSPAPPSLLVLPASLLSNWKAEIEKFAPSLSYLILHPSSLSKSQLLDLETRDSLPEKDLILISYGMLLRQEWLLKFQWNCVILDEAQGIKNAQTQQSKIVKKLKAHARIALTGTPIENRLGDLWSLFDFLCPGLLGNARTFKTFIKGLETQTSQKYAPLRRLIQPYILRRLKTDKSIINDLPDKIELYAYCYLSKAQAVLYKKVVDELAHALTNENIEGIKRQGLVLAGLLRLKQICNHPDHFRGAPEYDPHDSGKFTRLAELCEEIATRQEKVLVFTQFQEMTTPLSRFLQKCFAQPGLILDGKTPIKQRKELVERFQTKEGPPFFVLSLKAAGTGLNLTAASHVIHFDRWWNPAVENQATDRAFRIGQKSKVLVHKFVCKGTLEEKIDRLIQEKKNTAQELLEKGEEPALTSLSNEELLRFLSLDLNQIQE